MEIRKAGKGDVEEIVRLNNSLFRNEHENKFDTTLDMKWHDKEGKKHYDKIVSKNDSVVFVAEERGKIIGYLCGSISQTAYYRIKLHIATLSDMFVDEKFRNQKVGKKLFEYFENWCKENGIKRISVTASSRNKYAIRFYNKCGFEEYETTLEKELE